MKSKRKSLTGGKIPKRKRDQLKAQFTPDQDILDLANRQEKERAARKALHTKNAKFNKNKWFFQKERYDGTQHKEGEMDALNVYRNGEWVPRKRY